MHRFRSWVVLLVVTSASLFAVAPAIAQQATPGVAVDGVTVLEPDEAYAGVSRGEWDARSWQSAVSFPEAINPAFDSTGERCGYGQSGPVFIVPGAYTPEPIDRTCVVAEGTALFIVLGGSECSTVEPPPFFGRNEAELRACAAAFTDTLTDVQVSINGEEVPNIEAYRTSSPLFTMTFPEDNFFGVPPGVALSVSDSYSILIAPPPPGEYEITASAAFEEEGELIEFGGTIRIIVQAPQVIEPEATPAGGTPVATPEA
jgi:hypothetical protein